MMLEREHNEKFRADRERKGLNGGGDGGLALITQIKLTLFLTDLGSVYATSRRRTSSTSSSPSSSLFGPSFYTFPRYRSMDLPALTEDPSSWKGSSVLSVNQITPSGLELLFTVAQEMRTLVRTKGGDSRLQHKLVSTIFYEASTRTACSFQAAMMRLGGKHIHGECLCVCVSDD
eukprot:scaffold353_cov185-Amphora_coffeaeformis.AAC.42